MAETDHSDAPSLTGQDRVAQPPTAFGEFSVEDVRAELSFVICERRATINSIRRERKETEKLKTIRIEVVEKMIARTKQARRMVEAAPDFFEASASLIEAWDARTTVAQQIVTGKSDRELQAQAMAAIDRLRTALRKAATAEA